MVGICSVDLLNLSKRCSFSKGNRSLYCVHRAYFFKIWGYNNITKVMRAPAHGLLLDENFWKDIRRLAGLVIPKLICYRENVNFGKNSRVPEGSTLYVFEKVNDFRHLERLTENQLILLGEFMSILDKYNYAYYDFHYRGGFSNLAGQGNRLVIFDIDSSLPNRTSYGDFFRFYSNADFFHLFLLARGITKEDNLKRFNSLVYAQIALTSLLSKRNKLTFQDSKKYLENLLRSGDYNKIKTLFRDKPSLGVFVVNNMSNKNISAEIIKNAVIAVLKKNSISPEIFSPEIVNIKGSDLNKTPLGLIKKYVDGIKRILGL